MDVQLLDDVIKGVTEELEIKGSEINTFLKSLVFNLIIKNLDKEKRLEFVRILETKDKTKTNEFLSRELPDLRKILALEVKKEISQMSQYLDKYGK